MSALNRFDRLRCGDSRLSTFRIHILRLSDGFPRVLSSVDPGTHYVEYESRKILSSLDILASGYRLAAIAAFEGTSFFGRRNTLIVWDWRSGETVLVRPSRLSIPSQKRC